MSALTPVTDNSGAAASSGLGAQSRARTDSGTDRKTNEVYKSTPTPVTDSGKIAASIQAIGGSRNARLGGIETLAQFKTEFAEEIQALHRVVNSDEDLCKIENTVFNILKILSRHSPGREVGFFQNMKSFHCVLSIRHDMVSEEDGVKLDSLEQESETLKQRLLDCAELYGKVHEMMPFLQNPQIERSVVSKLLISPFKIQGAVLGLFRLVSQEIENTRKLSKALEEMIFSRAAKLRNIESLKGMNLSEENQVYLGKLGRNSIGYSDPEIPILPKELDAARFANERFNEAHRKFGELLKEREEKV